MERFNIYIPLLLFMLVFSTNGQAQNKFKSSIILGFTASQLGGDGISGYDKLGLVSGLRLAYPIAEKFDINMDLLYSQRGSRSSFGFSNADSTTTLNYLEIPVYISINDWFIEKENYFKVGAFAGLSYGYLINVNSNKSVFVGNEQDFNKNDLSARIGFYYSFSKSLTFRTYYTDSFVKLFESDELFRTESLDSFFWTFRIEYNL